jgi:hypothetical protein
VLNLAGGEATAVGIVGVDGTLISEILGDFTLRLRDIFR